ncbi:hypothetical protein BD311DRAFT_676088 [Dichomitus squalens]|uniref:Protein SMG7 n=1 Tax=Dichomitus squalens TaxID=114155 RepID=A0A4V2JYU0_9APHY|nr:hypothetical protein BD311DRAFT_676088 [Dichomitus squalens]
MQTSYAFIAVYKQRITALDRALHNVPRQQQQQSAQGQDGPGQGRGQGQGRGHGGHGVVEYRKLLQRFRQFLADEEKFWIQLIVRIRRIFALDDAQHVLAGLGIIPDDTTPPSENGPPKRNHYQFPSDADVAAVAPSLTPTTRDQREGRMAILSKALVCLGDIERYKEQYNEAGGRPRAGHEDGPPAAGASGNQKGGRGKKGAAVANGAGAQAPVMPRMRNYDKAQQCYQQARILLPQDGNPAHQMAILASYQKDVFGSLVHYYRALCVKSPYDTAAENLGTVLAKTLDQWKARGAKRDREREKELARGEAPSMAPRLRVESFKEKLIVLHALWRVPPEEAEALSPNLSNKLAEDFRSLVSERILPLDIVLKTTVLAQGALWKHRMFRSAPTNGHRKGSSLSTTSVVESSIAGHLLMMHRILLEVGVVQIAEAPPEDAGEHDLAQRITAAFRRTLPALRIASKWLRANMRYVGQPAPSGANGVEAETSSSKLKGRDRRRGNDWRSPSVSLSLTIPGLSEFWRAYAQFSTALHKAFPTEKLPKLVTTLEEDVEMAGFSPLKRFVPGEVVSAVGAAGASKDGAKDVRSGSANRAAQPILPEQVHPNEEQLMRIADLLVDAQAIVKDEASPLTFADGKFVVNGLLEPVASSASGSGSASAPAAPSHGAVQPCNRNSLSKPASPRLPSRIAYEPRPAEVDDDNMTDITRTEDDPVEQAFRKVFGPPTETGEEDEEEDEEDEIVWNPSASTGPRDPAIIAAVPAPLPAPPIRPLIASPPVSATKVSPRSPQPLSPRYAAQKHAATMISTAPPSAVTTAKDILSSVLRSPPRPDVARSLHVRQASAPHTTHMLFGSHPLGGTSIWSSNDTETVKFQGAAGTTSGPSYPSYHSQNLPQSPPLSTFSLQTQPVLGFGHPSVAPGPAHQYNSAFITGHQRVQSLSTTRNSQLYSSQSQSQSQYSDLFGPYPALAEQAPVSYNTGVPGAYADPIYSRKLDPTYSRQEAPGVGMNDRAVPFHLDQRAPGHTSAFPPPLSSMAQLWNNAG